MTPKYSWSTRRLTSTAHATGGADSLPRLHRRLVGSAVLAHPKEFTPVCTTDLGYLAKSRPEFDTPEREDRSASRWTPLERSRERGPGDIEETAGQRARTIRSSARPTTGCRCCYGMLPARTSGGVREVAPPADDQTVRNVFVVGPDKKVKLILGLPDDHRAQLRRGAARHHGARKLTVRAQGAPTPVNWRQGRGRDHVRVGVRTRRGNSLASWEAPRPYIRIVPKPSRRGPWHR